MKKPETMFPVIKQAAKEFRIQVTQAAKRLGYCRTV